MRPLLPHSESKLTCQLFLFVPIAVVGLACGGSDEEGNEPGSSASGGTSGSPPAMPAPATNGAGMPSAEDIAALTDALGMAAGQVEAACGATFDRCETTPGCNEILTCAALNACAGADCYCLGEGCAMDGPCRSVIDSAPGARAPDASNPSLGPASDAARAVGNCLLGLGGGGLPPSTTPTPLPTPPAGTGDAGASAPDAG